MSSTEITSLYIADPDDPSMSTPWINLTTLDEGGTLGFGLEDNPDWGGIDTDLQMAGDLPVDRLHPITTMTIPLLMKGYTDQGQFLADLERLAQAMDFRVGTFVATLSDGFTKRYIEYYYSPIRHIVQGQDMALQHFAAGFQETYVLEVNRAPYARWDPEGGDPKVLTTYPGNHHIVVNNPGNMPAPATLRITPDATARTVQFRFGRKSRGNLNQFASLYSFEIDDNRVQWTIEQGCADTAPAQVAGAQFGYGLVTSFATNKSHARRWRMEINATDTTALEGRYKVFCHMLLPAQTRLTVGLRWGVADVQPVESTNDVVVLDNSTGTAPQLVEVELGEVTAGLLDKHLVLEGWAGRPPQLEDGTSNGTGTLGWDTIDLVPCDEQFATISVLGFQSGSSGSTVLKGKDLLRGFIGGSPRTFNQDNTRVPLDGASAKLGDLDDALAEAPFTGQYLPTGRHIWVVTADMQNNARDIRSMASLQLVQLDPTNGALTTPAETILKTRNGSAWTRRSWQMQFQVTSGAAYDGNAPKLFMLRVVGLNALDTSDSRKVWVKQLEHKFLRYAGGVPMTLDGLQRTAQVQNAAFERTSEMTVDGGYLTLAPGDNLIVILPGEQPSSLFPYTEIDARGPLVAVSAAFGYQGVINHLPQSAPI